MQNGNAGRENQLTYYLKNFENKKVFITGHTGFKGSWLCLLLSKAGAEIKGYALPPLYEDSLFENIKDDLNIISEFNDIRNAQKLTESIASFQPDFIFHLAAQPLVRYSYQQPVETFEVNVIGTVNVLDAMRLLNKKCTALIVTTDKVYENTENGEPFSENDKLGGHDPYSSSKAAAEIVTQSYQRSFFETNKFNVHQKAVATARAGNVIGGGDRATDRIFPDLIRSLENGVPLEIRNPEAIRPWQHVLDPLSGYIQLASLLDENPSKYTGSYNFGPMPGDELSVKELVETAIKCWGNGTYQITPDKEYYEAKQLRLDITKAQTLLNWHPSWNSIQAIQSSIEWFRGVYFFNNKSIDISLENIKMFYITHKFHTRSVNK
jgi:CDP-glucose 4,6-dehydratase